MVGPAEAFVEDPARFHEAGSNYPILRVYAETGEDMFGRLQIFDEEVRAKVTA